MNHASQFANDNREVIEMMDLKSGEIEEDQEIPVYLDLSPMKRTNDHITKTRLTLETLLPSEALSCQS